MERGRRRMKKVSSIVAAFCLVLFVLVGCAPSVETIARTTDEAKLTDQAVLAQVALEAESWPVRAAAAGKLTDQAVLAQVALEDESWPVRAAAAGKLTDQAVLGKLAMKDKDGEVRRTAVEHLTDQAVLAQVALETKDGDVRAAALWKLADQAVLAKVATENQDGRVRSAAVERLTDQALLAKVATESKWLEIRLTAIGNVTDQVLLRQWAERDHQAAIRRASVRRITDDRFLVQRLPAEPSASVRTAMIEALRENDSLRQVALTAYHEPDRKQAAQRLRQVWRDPPSDVATAHESLAKRVEALAAETDSGKVLALALKGEFDVLRSAAAQWLNDPAALEQAALRSRDREVQKILLAKLEDKSLLNRIAAASDDRAMRLAAAQKAGARSWQVIFDAATAKGATVQMLGDALAAVSLFPAVQGEAVAGVQRASLNLIRRGDESRIPEMVDLLEGYGDMTLAEDYLNCGQPDLDASGLAWARRRGYSVSSGFGSHRAGWGSDR
jgi:hypothetical protein